MKTKKLYKKFVTLNTVSNWKPDQFEVQCDRHSPG